MDTKIFIEECNRSPLLKKYRPITKKTLIEVDFLLKEYTVDDLKELEGRLSFIPPTVLHNTNKPYLETNRSQKDMAHLKLLDLLDNKKLLKKVRQHLKIPNTSKGFMVLGRIKPEKIYTNIFPQTISKEYEKWMLEWANHIATKNKALKLRYASQIVHDEIFNATTFLLSKWKLPWRYYDALVELILFNTIIPADPGIAFGKEYGIIFGKKPKMYISFDIDTTKEELVEYIKKDPSNIFKKKHPYFIGRTRYTSRKPEEIAKMIQIYNKHKKDGEKDKQIFCIIQSMPEFSSLSISAIRDRIKRK